MPYDKCELAICKFRRGGETVGGKVSSILKKLAPHVWHALCLLHLYCILLHARFFISIYNVNILVMNIV